MSNIEIENCLKNITRGTEELGRINADLVTIAIDLQNELNEAKVMLLANYGPEGRAIPDLVGLEMRLSVMVYKVFKHYHEKDVL